MQPLALIKSVKQFLPLSLASVSSLVNFQMHERRGITYSKTLGDVEAKTLVIRIINFFELEGFQGPLEQKQVEWRNLSWFPVCLGLLRVVPA